MTVTGADGLSNSGGTLSYTYNGSATVPTAAGIYAVVATFTPGDTTDYTSSTGTAIWTINAAATPTITVSTGSLNLGTVTAGTAGTAQTYTVSGSNLTADIARPRPAGWMGTILACQ